MPPSPVIPPDDGAVVTLAHWLVGIFSALLGSIFTAGALVWRGGSFTTGIKRDIEAMKTEIAANKARIDSFETTNNERHIENVKELHRLATAQAATPDKHDFQRLEDAMLQRFDRLEQALMRASHRGA